MRSIFEMIIIIYVATYIIYIYDVDVDIGYDIDNYDFKMCAFLCIKL